MTRKLVAIAASFALIAVACSSGSSTTTTEGAEPATSGQQSATTAAATGSQDITVTLVDVDATTMLLTPSSDSAPAGEITFTVTNSGDKVHEFVVFQTDLAIDQLPTNESGSEVIEDGPGLTLIDEIEDIQPGDTMTLTVTLDGGSYALICNLKGHYRMGMRSAFTVS